MALDGATAGDDKEEGSADKKSCAGKAAGDLCGEYTARRKSSQRSGMAPFSTQSHKLACAWFSSLSNKHC